VTHVVDKGAGRGATVTYVKELTDKASGERLATVTHTTFGRGDGGFSANGGKSDAPPTPLAKVPDRTPDQGGRDAYAAAAGAALPAVRRPQPAALRARGGAQGRVPAADPARARHLRGRCHAMLATLCDYDPARLARLSVRFSSPVLPGRDHPFRDLRRRQRIRFRARMSARDKVVLDYGRVALR
jgi:hypothetical protein